MIVPPSFPQRIPKPVDSIKRCAIAASNRTYGYHANGNLVSDGTTNYVYDVENRLVSASGLTNAPLLYDPLGRLVRTSGDPAEVPARTA